MERLRLHLPAHQRRSHERPILTVIGQRCESGGGGVRLQVEGPGLGKWTRPRRAVCCSRTIPPGDT